MKTLLWTLLLTPALLLAGTVELKDGSRLVGDVSGLTDGKLKVKTTFAGVIEIDRAQVVSIETEEPRVIELSDGSRVVAKAQKVAGGKTTLTTDYGSLEVQQEQITGIWAVGDPGPRERELAAAKPKWKTEVRGGVSGSTGTTEEHTFAGGFTTTMATPNDRLKFYGDVKYAEQDDEVTDKDYRAGVDFEHFLAEKHSWYARTELESDRVNGPRLRTTAAAGYGYYAIRKPTQELRFRLGAQYRHEDWDDSPSEESTGIDVGLLHWVDFGKWAKLTTEVTYTPDLEETDDYVAVHESSLDVPLTVEPWSFRLGMRNEYTSITPDDSEHWETDYFAQLVYTFK